MSSEPNAPIIAPTSPRPRVNIPISRRLVDRREIQKLTTDLVLENLDVQVYRHPQQNWLKVNTFYNCECGRYLGYCVQEPIIPPSPPAERVVDLTTPPPPQVPNQPAIVEPSVNDSVISVASSSSSSLLVELYSLPYLSDESQAQSENLPSIYDPLSNSGEPMSQDVSMLSNEA